MRHLSPLAFVPVVAVVAGCADRSLPPAGEVARLRAEVADLQAEVADLRGVILGTIASSAPAGEVGRLRGEVADLRGAVEQLQAAPGGRGKRLHWFAAGVDVGPAAPSAAGPAAWVEALGGPGDILSAAQVTFATTDCTGEGAIPCQLAPGHVARLSPTGGGWIRPGRPVSGSASASRLIWDSDKEGPACISVHGGAWEGCEVVSTGVPGIPARLADLRLEWR